ncbi:NAD(P)/FAD-dependent oxidoreductase [Cupriavidus necator]|uniref:NAD(P)/FAD-dependent oxidoreductase n=1 Tax=Cupriavidus necator (strain ATCC 17699 / DSM 428 / KCTC 22496 / NCIMB 10442 / H16 / Stanier 337) TaxID=381666 RepID=Q0KAU3_CUPNH|nr:NAD(P)/FAD-dependent oxidoreductase [Cupriavidus necator]QCC00737.1 NAD(P)/FAD-dependent oxidoreductase [Cupriavidus necator H16]QQB76437.1 NAD(P)/FAD-dependent oxidoreductase [Cupriavidus necator]WKA42621.1 NAD(P)/FAD-dependent oxidoreductase [Cupriavidus necator]CAJ92878.1 putative dehydrogenase, oxidoreductase FAD flavoprotein [Cupriavidus necator H16]
MSKRIVVIGAGFAGMWSALGSARLLDEVGRTDVEIVLVAPEPELHVRPRLYEKNPGGMRAPLQEIFQAVGVRFIQGLVERIDVVSQKVELVGLGGDTSRRKLGYDRLVLAAGSRLFRPQIPGLEQHSFNVDQVADAAALDAHLASLARRPESVARNTVVIAGAGFTGIETAAEMPARLREVFGKDAAVNVIMVERNSDVGPDLGPGPRPVITEALTELGVTWKLGSGVAAVDANGVTLENGQRIETDTVIWTAGARASALTSQIPAQRDNFGRLHVDRNLKVKGIDTVYATGDVAYASTDEEGNHAAMSCQHAMKLGRIAGHNVAADLLGATPIPYSQPKYVTCLDLGSWGAVYTEGWDRQVKLVGAEAKALKTQINTEWIYPPSADRAEALAWADPHYVVVA